MEVTVGSIADVKHVVILMQENRSFDHYFGLLRGVRGFFDPTAIHQSDGTTIFAQKKAGGTPSPLFPWRMTTTLMSGESAPGNPHGWADQHIPWDNGLMDKFWSHQPNTTCMGYLTEDDIAYHTALAQTFTICDGYHCSVLGPTAPNRLYLMSGTIDAAGVHGTPATGNPSASTVYHWTSYPEQLAAAGVDWAVYDEASQSAHASPFDLNVASYFAGWSTALTQTPNGHRTTAGQFESDLVNNKLPKVSWLIPPYDHSEHPAFPPQDGAHWMAQKINALIASPYWSSTVFILCYDENDGGFDHVPPLTAPSGTADEWVTTGTNTGVVGPGMRVPCIVISPWSVGGRVSTPNYDHTSVLRLLETVTGVTAANISAWRRANMHSLADALDFTTTPVAAADVPALPAAPAYVSSGLPAASPPAVQFWPPSTDRLGGVGWPGSKAYFFKGANYLRYTTGTTGVAQHPDPGYPAPIAGNWPELTSVDTGIVFANGKAYLFKDNQYVRYSQDPSNPTGNASTYTPDAGYPALIWKNWSGFWASDFDAAVLWPTGKMYFFKGAEYIRCSTNMHVPDAGYPKPILGNWPGVAEAFPNGVDAVMVWSADKAYFFKDGQYVRYTITAGSEGVDAGYPKAISNFSPELAVL
jgi:phospholipase C